MTSPTQDPDWGGRLPLLDPATLRDDQRERYEAIVEYSAPWAERSGFRARTEDGRLMGPFNVHLHSPTLARGYSRWISAEQQHTALPTTVREVVILTVGVAWQAAYEIYAHVAVARSVGLDEAVVDAIRSGRTTDDFRDDEAAAHDFTQALVTTHAVDEATYRRAVDVLGQQAVVDMVHLIGLYLATSAMLNAFEIPAPGIPERS